MSENIESNITIINTDMGEIKLSPSLVKNYLVNGNGAVTNQEILMFISLCKYQQLNPFLREAYLIKFGNSPATMVVGKEVFTKRAAKIEDCCGWQAGVIVINSTGEVERRKGSLVLKTEQLVGGWCEVHRKSWKVPVVAEVSLDEFIKYNGKGEIMSTWKQMPATMIRKVAIVTALRETFPEHFQQMYAQEEMPVSDCKLPEDEIIIQEN